MNVSWSQYSECFGVLWDGTDSLCDQCADQLRCLKWFASRTVPDASKRLDLDPSKPLDDTSLIALSDELSVSVEAVRVATASNLPAPEGDPPSRPTSAGRVVSVTRPAINPEKVTDPRSIAAIAAGPDVKRIRHIKWYEGRCRREKERYPFLLQLRAGEKIWRKFKQVVYWTTPLPEDLGWMFEQLRYPTLYLVTKAIVGTDPSRQSCTWNPIKFWDPQNPTTRKYPGRSHALTSAEALVFRRLLIQARGE